MSTRRINKFIGAMLLSASLAPMSGYAQDAFIDEFRFGGTWAQPEIIDEDHPEGNQGGINVEVLFAPLNFDHRGDAADGFVHSILTPRIHLGGMINLSDEGTSLGYAGLTWHFDLTERIFVETSFGASLNNGKIDGAVDANLQLTRARLGSRILFRESLALGFNVTENVTAILQIDHNSHAGLAHEKNRGLTGTHFKIGYKF